MIVDFVVGMTMGMLTFFAVMAIIVLIGRQLRGLCFYKDYK